METMGTRIKELLDKKHMSQKELAEKIGCTDAAVSHYIKGDRVPRSSVLISIAAALDTTADYLSAGIPINATQEIGYARKLIARNVKQMSTAEKKAILDILIGDSNE